MQDCHYTSSLQRYYDGELDAEQSRELERHLPDCLRCAAELARLRELSTALSGARPAPIRGEELERIHAAIDDQPVRSLFRFSMAISGLAASVLIISAAWLYDAPRPAAQPIMVRSVPHEQSWERLAQGGPSSESPDRVRETGVAKRDATDWMVLNLGGGRGGHANR